MAKKTAATRDCRQQIDTLFAYLDSELTPARARRIEQHLASCDCCGALAESLRRAMALCRAAGGCEVPAKVHRRAVARARTIMGKRFL